MRLPRRQVLSLMICGSVLLAGPDSAYRSGLPQPAHHNGGALSSRRRGGHNRSSSCRTHAGIAGPAGHCRECDVELAGSIGPGRVARAANDGYTLGLGTSGTHVLNGATMALPYDVVNDFEPIALLSSQPLMIVTRKDMPANNLKELIAWLQSNPDKATQGTTGPGSTNHLAGVLFQQSNEHALLVRALPRHQSGDARPGRRANRYDLRSSVSLHSARACWHH